MEQRLEGLPGQGQPELALQKIKIILDAMQAHTGKRPIIYTDPKFHHEVLEGEFPDIIFGCARSPPNLTPSIANGPGPSGSSPPPATCRG